jgi:UDP-N-acetylglucosamine transferase subunit ALG13
MRERARISTDLGQLLMIFVTLGTHPAPMDRLVLALDALATPDEEIVIQAATVGCKPNHVTLVPVLAADQFEDHLRQSDLLICHGGPSTIISALKTGHPLLVVPRRHCYGEHVDDHQVEFARFMHRKYAVPFVLEMDELPEAIQKVRGRQTNIVLPNTLGDLCDRLDLYTRQVAGRPTSLTLQQAPPQ